MTSQTETSLYLTSLIVKRSIANPARRYSIIVFHLVKQKARGKNDQVKPSGQIVFITMRLGGLPDPDVIPRACEVLHGASTFVCEVRHYQ
jgi:hypothetical protein